LASCIALASCSVPALITQDARTKLPDNFGQKNDTANMANIKWRHFFADTCLLNLIDTALRNNQEMLITLQEIEIARNEIRMRKSALLPTVSVRAGAGVEKVGRYTSQGAGDASTDIAPGRKMPEPLTDLNVGLYANWEVDIWKKLRSAKKAALNRYLATVEGRNFVITNLVAEIATAYYELISLDNQLDIVQQNIDLQQRALEIVKIQKQAARSTELAVQKFEAEVYKTKSLEYEIRQQIKETENSLNLLLGRFPQPIIRFKGNVLDVSPTMVHEGIPSQVLSNRPDIKQAELELQAAKLDVKVARAAFYPSFGISATIGFQAFNPAYLVRLPESLLGSLIGDLAGPLINRNAIKAEFNTASAKQLQVMYNYERTILAAYLQVSTRLSAINNLDQGYVLKSKQVAALNRSIEVANDLFRSARADYFEVLMTQRDALEAKLELIETRKLQLNAVVSMYKELGGGWK